MIFPFRNSRTHIIHRPSRAAARRIPQTSITGFSVILLGVASLSAQEPDDGSRSGVGTLFVERSVENRTWEVVSPDDLEILGDGRLWMPFLDRHTVFRLAMQSKTPETAQPLSIGIGTSRSDGTFLEIQESSDVKTWRTMPASQLLSNDRGVGVSLDSTTGFWRLNIGEIPPDPKPVAPLTFRPNPAALFEAHRAPVLTEAIGGGQIGEWDPSLVPDSFPGPEAFNQYIFEERIHQLFEGDVKGYAVVIGNEDGFKGKVAGGWARDPAEGALRMSTFRPGNIGSAAKMYAGVAIMRLLEQQGPDFTTALDQTIEAYLPKRWLNNISASHKAITFRMLLNHTSGFADIQSTEGPANREDHPDYLHFTSGLRATQGSYNYSNENYRILTYLIPRLAYADQIQAIENAYADADFELYLDEMRDGSGLAFENYMDEDFFPLVDGNFNPGCDPANDYPAGTTALMYSSPNDQQGLQWSQKDESGFCRGQGGYWTSAQELARFMSSVVYTGDLIDPANAQLLTSPSGPWLVTDSSNSHAGFTEELTFNRWRAKRGRQPSGRAPFGTGRAEAMFMPYGWVCSAVINSDSLSDPNLDTRDTMASIMDAFFDATRDEPMTISRGAMTVAGFLMASTELRQRRMEVHWLDFYDIAGTPYVNAVFGEASQPIAGQIGMNGDEYQAFLSEWVEDKGFAIRQVESYLDEGKIRYAAIITEDDRPEQRAYHGKTEAMHEVEFLAARDDGFVPMNVSVVSLNGKRWYTTFYEKRAIKFQMRSQLTAEAYQSEYESLAEEGYSVVSLNAYWHGEVPYYAAIWHQAGESQGAIHHALRDDYRASDALQLNAGRLPTIITGLDSGNANAPIHERHAFGAVWDWAE